MFHALGLIGRALTGSGVLWGVGGSVLLNRHGLADHPHDIDLLACLEHAEKAAALLAGMGETLPCEPSGTYATRFFRRFVIAGTGVDLLSGFRINHDCGRYEYVFDEDSLPEHGEIGGEAIPFAALEDWYVAYQLIPGKEHKARRIEEHLLRNGIGNPRLLERALWGCLPEPVRNRIEALLGGRLSP